MRGFVRWLSEAVDPYAFDSFGEPDNLADLTCHFLTFGMVPEDNSTSAVVSITGCDDPSIVGDPNVCEAGDDGFYEATTSDLIKITKECVAE